MLTDTTNMNKKIIITKTKIFIRTTLKPDCTGHDYLHAERVLKLALIIAKKEKAQADEFIISLAALLHDLDDWKFNDDQECLTGKAHAWLKKLKIDQNSIDQVCTIIQEIPFKGAKVKNKINTIEAKIAQDADRLDAMGAIGIARAFAYGGYKNRLIFDEKIKKKLHATFNDYKKKSSTTINHFHEKLLLLKDRMNTKTGYELAKKRHAFMEKFLKQFYADWKDSDLF